jgi:hypothetical protein
VTRSTPKKFSRAIPDVVYRRADEWLAQCRAGVVDDDGRIAGWSASAATEHGSVTSRGSGTTRGSALGLGLRAVAYTSTSPRIERRLDERFTHAALPAGDKDGRSIDGCHVGSLTMPNACTSRMSRGFPYWSSLKGRGRSTPFLVLIFFRAVPPPARGRVEVGGGVKDRPEGDRVSGRRSLMPSPVGACCSRRRDRWAGGSGRGVGSVGVVLLQCQVSRLVDRPPVGGCRSSLRRAPSKTTVTGMVRCDKVSRWTGSIRRGGHAGPVHRARGS